MTWDPGSQGTNLNKTDSDHKVDYSEISSQPVHKHRSVELDDILEESSIEEEESLPPCDSDTTPDSSSPISSASPDSSFRISRSSSNRSDAGTENSGEVDNVFPAPIKHSTHREKVDQFLTRNNLNALSQKLSQKSHDSGFSDSSDSNQHNNNNNNRLIESPVTSHPDKVETPRTAIKSSVVHESHPTSTGNKMHHVSKVYFYSVSDILKDNNKDYEDHVAILASESSRGLDSSVSLPFLSPRSDDSSEPNTPRINASACDFDMPYVSLDSSIPTKSKTPRNPMVSTLPFVQRPQSPRIHTGTSSLNRKSNKTDRDGKNNSRTQKSSNNMAHNTTMTSPTPSQNGFPKTNGSLYSDLSLGRELADKNRAKRRTGSDSCLTDFNRSYDYRETNNSLASGDPDSSLDVISHPSISRQTSSSSDPFIPVSSSPSICGSIPVEEHKSYRGQVIPQSGSERAWLVELRQVHESECTIMLQSKPVRGRGMNGSRDDASADATVIKDKIKSIQQRAHVISAVFARLCREVMEKSGSKLVPFVQGLAHQLQLFLLEYNSQYSGLVGLNQFPGYIRRESEVTDSMGIEVVKQQGALVELCDKLRTSVARQAKEGAVENLVDVVTELGAGFTKLVELMLGMQIQACVNHLCGWTDPRHISKPAVDTIISLALEGNHLCRMLANHGAVEALVTICKESPVAKVRVAALRGMGTVCCVLEGIREFEAMGGVDLVVKQLKDRELLEEERSEAAGVLAQVTSPWIENNVNMLTVPTNMGEIVAALTDLAMRTISAETFLLASAALANLTFMSEAAVSSMTRLGSVSVLVNHPAASSTPSIYIQDQVAAVLANMAAWPASRREVMASGGLRLLVRILESKRDCMRGKVGGPMEAATERVLQKTAIAISRLSVDPSAADAMISLGGIELLVDLVRARAVRGDSDNILTAALAAIRAVTANTSTGIDSPLLLPAPDNFAHSLESFV